LPDHDVLGVGPGATRGEVTEAFRRFALTHHPDRGGDPKTFQAGLAAYRRLAGAGAHPAARLRPGESAGHDVVFHRRSRPGVPSLLRVAGRRLAALRSHP
jgi:hypothetical protein